VHYSFDILTSPNHSAFFGVEGLWISATGNLVTAVLGMEHFCKPHTSANQVDIFWKLLEQYRLKNNIDYIAVHNATNNDNAMNARGKLFSMVNSTFDPVSARMQYF
jgi:hypothetical protein